MIGIEPSDPPPEFHAPGLIHHSQGILVRGRAFGHEVCVVVETADPLVELDELLDVYQTVVQGLSDRIERPHCRVPCGARPVESSRPRRLTKLSYRAAAKHRPALRSG